MVEIQYRCAECGATFHSQADLEQHNRTVHSLYTCEICGERFDSESEFETHNRITHPEGQKTRRA